MWKGIQRPPRRPLASRSFSRPFYTVVLKLFGNCSAGFCLLGRRTRSQVCVTPNQNGRDRNINVQIVVCSHHSLKRIGLASLSRNGFTQPEEPPRRTPRFCSSRLEKTFAGGFSRATRGGGLPRQPAKNHDSPPFSTGTARRLDLTPKSLRGTNFEPV